MEARGPQQAALLVHDGELADVRALLDQLETPLVEYRGVPAPRDGEIDWGLVVASARRMLELGAPSAAEANRVVRIAVADSWSRTLRTAMNRLHADFVVGRPVHPEALRLLLLRGLYRGPERRRAPRFAVGKPIHFRVQRKLNPAILLDLSQTGCRLLGEKSARRGEELTVALPTESGRTLSVRGRLVQVGPAPQGTEGAVLHVAFDTLTPLLAQQLGELVAEFVHGPARLPDDTSRPREAREEEPVPDPDEDLPVFKLGDDELDDSERRGTMRRLFSKRVIAHRDDATRVLIGRDISPGGMRIEKHPDLGEGDEISLALPLPAERVPLVLQARVARDDGERGQVLEFSALSEELQGRLRRNLEFLATTDSPFGEEEPAWVIVSEILERRSA